MFRSGGIDSTLLKEKEFLDFFYRGLQTDLSILETYQTKPDSPKLKTKAVVLKGSQDAVNSQDSALWHRFLENLTIKEFPGNHFFIFDSQNAEQIAWELESSMTYQAN